MKIINLITLCLITINLFGMEAILQKKQSPITEKKQYTALGTTSFGAEHLVPFMSFNPEKDCQKACDKRLRIPLTCITYLPGKYKYWKKYWVALKLKEQQSLSDETDSEKISDEELEAISELEALLQSVET